MNATADTIVARATPAGVGAVAVVRCSGPVAIEAMKRCFEPVSKASTAAARAASVSHRMRLGHWRDPRSSEAIDTVLAVRMDAPHSFTGEDVVEVHCHGGPAVVEAVIDSFVACGARLAGPGEFTRRAFLNGRMDLAQAEAVADVVQARAARARRMAQRQLDGELSERVAAFRSRLIDVIAELEAYLDFPEEDLPETDQARLLGEIEALRDQIRRFAAQGKRGRLFRDGARVVIAGPPNVGKSSLFNALVGRERALVSPHPGTTRDTIESTIELDGLAITLVDTAGLRAEGAEEIEQLGIERATGEIRGADAVLWLRDASGESPPAAPPALEGKDETLWLRVGTKADKIAPARRQASRETECLVSSITGEGVAVLEQALARRLLEALGAGAQEEDVLVSSRRHVEALEAAADSLDRALGALRSGASSEFAIVDLRAALDSLGAILGQDAGDAVLDAIFSRFCIGK